MAVLIVNEGSEWTRELYDETAKRAMPDPDNPPQGLLVHISAPKGSGWQVIDVWESQEAYDTFVHEKLMPAAQELDAPPFDSTFIEVHNLIVRAGAGG